MLNSSSPYRNVFQPSTALWEFTLCRTISFQNGQSHCTLNSHPPVVVHNSFPVSWQALSGQSFLLCCFLIDCILGLSEILDVKPYDKSHVKLQIQSWGVLFVACAVWLSRCCSGALIVSATSFCWILSLRASDRVIPSTASDLPLVLISVCL